MKVINLNLNLKFLLQTSSAGTMLLPHENLRLNSTCADAT